MQIESTLFTPALSAQLFMILSIVSIMIGCCLIIFGLVRQKKHKKGMLATGCIVFGFLIIISHTIQIVVRML